MTESARSTLSISAQSTNSPMGDGPLSGILGFSDFLSFIKISADPLGSASGRLVYRPIYPQVVAPAPVVDTTRSGGGGIDPRRPFKPTGLEERKKKTKVEERVDESREIQAEIAAKLAREFTEENEQTALALAEARAAEIRDTLSQAEIAAEIQALLRKRLRTEDDELLILMLIAASV